MREPGTYKFLESPKSNALFLLPFHRVVDQDSHLEDMCFPLAEQRHAGEEGAAWVLGRVREQESQDEPHHAREAAHEDEQPESSAPSCDTSHVQDPVRG